MTTGNVIRGPLPNGTVASLQCWPGRGEVARVVFVLASVGSEQTATADGIIPGRHARHDGSEARLMCRDQARMGRVQTWIGSDSFSFHPGPRVRPDSSAWRRKNLGKPGMAAWEVVCAPTTHHGPRPGVLAN